MDSRIDRRRLMLALTGVIALGYPSNAAQAEDSWPTRIVKVIVPVGGGSGTDLFARFICDQLSKRFAQTFIIENKPGANGMLGSDAVAKADGYTLLFSNASSTVMLKGLNPKMPFDLEKDFTPIVQIGAGGVLLVVNPSLQVKNVGELVELIRSNPDKYNYGTWGVGSFAHLIMEGLKSKTGMQINHVPFKTMSQLQQSILSGELQIGWSDAASGEALVRSGLLKVLCISGSHRSPKIPDMATLKEQGFGFDNDGWYGLFAPTGVSQDIVDKVNLTVNQIMESPEGRDYLQRLNAPSAPPNTPAQFAETIQNDIKTWTEVVRENHITIE